MWCRIWSCSVGFMEFKNVFYRRCINIQGTIKRFASFNYYFTSPFPRQWQFYFIWLRMWNINTAYIIIFFRCKCKIIAVSRFESSIFSNIKICILYIFIWLCSRCNSLRIWTIYKLVKLHVFNISAGNFQSTCYIGKIKHIFYIYRFRIGYCHMTLIPMPFLFCSLFYFRCYTCYLCNRISILVLNDLLSINSRFVSNFIQII